MTAEPLDFSGSRAILIGTSDYENGLAQIKAAEHSLNAMHRLLTGPLCGWPPDLVTVKHNEQSSTRLLRELTHTIKAASGTLLFYYVGHGLMTPDADLCMALSDTDELPEIRSHTGLQLGWLRGLMRDSIAQVKVAILDCCFSGIAVQDIQAGVTGPFVTPIRGAYTLTASHASLPARHETEGQRPRTHFTKHLVELVLEGVPGAPADLTLDDIFPHLRNRLVQQGLPEPQCAMNGTASKFVLARNAAPQQTFFDPVLEMTRLRAENIELKEQLETALLVMKEQARELTALRTGSSPSTTASEPARPTGTREKVVVLGGFGSGKTTFIGAVSEIEPVRTEQALTTAGLASDDTAGVEQKMTTTTALDYGRITLSSDLAVHLFAPPGADRFWYLWDELVVGAFVAIVLVDVRRLADSFPAIDYVETRGLPHVLAVNEFDGAARFTSEQIRQALDIEPSVPIIACDARDRASVQALIIEAMEYAESQPRPANEGSPAEEPLPVLA